MGAAAGRAGGYPLRYQSGTSSALITLEHRIYTGWYPFRLFNVGGAVFFDSGLRLGNSRSGLGSVVHVDFSYALDAVPGEDRFQITIETRQGF